ncbi:MULTISPECIES: ligase-associated DNA damage response endonuclease PdeM [Rhodobacterales]|uniref:ligase-associated DNA damage response endonuclease PdeM n=1 Tax=Rhodobacterales TaxID=204455 RepID=UPI00237FCC4D|nr:ligase-associated DNA damage response endonuclease PdeM [Phaeobacter gallaeciensis]MDE4140527.1 ligase-associated DNA damage response endonuclease PdeM [Phaeobacter gallaeciensis]MDE4148780.1 ligase-associated DNA damage response endonuclease PdeM [Phaeobacter gallaeciensis]MDE4153002.1 ligase-associated DNA damage response endonuclease PdeM [Phaeobacter gallaeciensis]MDE4228584.1 ligase-associated DNA damage response endonuclease PdeM [Phaeobacter gallaeciensis]MDE4257660.1 ligase-associat
MVGYDFTLAGARLTALGSGALWWAERRLLCVSDLHMGKSERHLRRGGAPLPPYETRDTLARLAKLIRQLRPETVLCLGDSFDDLAAAQALPPEDVQDLRSLIAAQDWIWVEGNHDPGPTGFGGRSCTEMRLGPLTFRHIAEGDAEAGEISGHYHPKARLRRGSARPAFLLDRTRLILPAFGTYTGGLRSSDPALAGLMAPEAIAILTGPKPLPCPMPR